MIKIRLIILFILNCFVFAKLNGAEDLLLLKMTAEYEYGLFDSVIHRADEVATPEQYSILCQAYLTLLRYDSVVQHDSVLMLTSSGQYCLARAYAQLKETAKSCSALQLYLQSDTKVSAAQIQLNPDFSSVATTDCWTTIWKQTWYPEPTEWDEFDLLLKNQKFNQLLDQIYALTRRVDISLYYEASALYGLGQSRDALQVLKNVSCVEGVLLRWRIQVSEKNFKTSLESAYEYKRKCNRCISAEKMIAESALGVGHTTEAFEAITKYLTIYYMDVDGLCIAAEVAQKEGRFLDALSYTNTALKYSRTCTQALLIRGNVFFELANWDLASKSYMLYLDFVRSDRDALEKLGISLLNKGDYQQGCRELNFAIQQGSESATFQYRKFCTK